jgi:hypothetical protein
VGTDIDDQQIIKFQDASQYAFEAGVQMACLIILHNWFPVEIRGFVVALWLSSGQLIAIVHAAWFKTSGSDHYIEQSLSMSLVYVILAIVCLYFFYHHPQHIGVVVQRRVIVSAEDFGFFVDSLGTNVALSSTQINKGKRNASLFDVFKHQE